MDIITYMIVFLLIILLGYSLGRRKGYKEGYSDGVKYTPLELKRNVYKLSRCPICNKPIDENNKV